MIVTAALLLISLLLLTVYILDIIFCYILFYFFGINTRYMFIAETSLGLIFQMFVSAMLLIAFFTIFPPEPKTKDAVIHESYYSLDNHGSK